MRDFHEPRSPELGPPRFEEWPKIARLNRDIIITEKLDGTNAAIGVYAEGKNVACPGGGCETVPTGRLLVYAQSRTRVLRPGETDNFGFRAWVEENAEMLKLLGPGLHFGEWWGQGIQRGYGLRHRTFSLFNTRRWVDKPEEADVIRKLKETGLNIDVVPVLYQGPRFIKGAHASVDAADHMIERLNERGSAAAPGHMNPEGIVVFHTAAQIAFKVTCEKDEQPKGQTETGRITYRGDRVSERIDNA